MMKKMLLLVLLSLAASTAMASADAEPFAPANEAEFKLSGPNVCIDQKTVVSTTNVSYYQSQKVKEYTWCLKVPPRCPKWSTKIVQK